MAETVIPRLANPVALKTEIALPAYTGMTDAQILVAVNAKMVAAPTQGQLLVKVSDIVNCFDPTEFATLTAVPLAKLQLLLQGPLVDVSKVSGANLRTMVGTIFPANGPTRAALKVLTDAADAIQAPWALITLGVPAIVQADLAQARAS